jgi:CPA1 family monovalent cation:H+ antiporter
LGFTTTRRWPQQRAEVLAARREPGVDPAAADRVLNRLDLRTVLLD